MKSLVTLGIISFAMTFCGLGERLKSMTGSGNSSSNTVANSTSNTSSTSSASTEKAKLSSAQQVAIDGGTETKWDDQGISWTLPKGWKKMDVKKESFNYQGPDNSFLLVNISVMPDSFPMDVSMKAYHEQALQQLKNGKYESVRMLEIDGVEGVEFTEAAPEEKDGIRRHQWIVYRTYLGQKQQVNVMTTTKASNFAKNNDTFSAIMYTTKFVK